MGGARKGSKGLHPSTTEEKHEKRQKQTTLTESIRSSSSEDEVDTLIMIADTSSTYMDMEALELEEQRQWFLSCRGQFITISLTANIVSVGIRWGAPSSVGSLSSVNPSSSTSQYVLSPRISYASSPLWFERTDEQHILTNQLRVELANTKSKRRYGKRSMLGPGDLKVIALLEVASWMLEKYLLSKNPFPIETELLAIMYTDPGFIY